MANIVHSTLTGSELHEPKGADTAPIRSMYISDGVGSGSWRQMLGWANYQDSQYTSGSPLVVNTGPTQVTIDGLQPGTDDTRLPNIWSSVNNRINENTVTTGDAYHIRLTFQAEVATSGEFVDIALDIGGGIGIIVEQTFPLLKAASTSNFISFSTQIFVGSTFVVNGGTFNISTSASTNCYNFALFVTKEYSD